MLVMISYRHKQTDWVNRAGVIMANAVFWGRANWHQHNLTVVRETMKVTQDWISDLRQWLGPLPYWTKWNKLFKWNPPSTPSTFPSMCPMHEHGHPAPCCWLAGIVVFGSVCATLFVFHLQSQVCLWTPDFFSPVQTWKKTKQNIRRYSLNFTKSTLD